MYVYIFISPEISFDKCNPFKVVFQIDKICLEGYAM